MKTINVQQCLKTPIILLCVLLLSSGLSCAVAPTAGAPSGDQDAQMSSRQASEAVQQAFAQYSRREFAAAASSFDSVVASAGAKPVDLQLAHLGKSLVYLSTDPNWRDLDAAALALQSAEGVTSNDNSVQLGMLVDAVSSLIGAEKNNSELMSKVNNAAYELGKLKEALEMQDAEVETLNDALEKLKNLTIGN